MISKILEAVNENTIVAIVSDHGHIANTYFPDINKILEEHGYLTRNSDGSINWQKTKAVGGAEGIWINLKGRDPQGVVNPSEYDEVVDEIIDVLRVYKCPLTNECAFDLVLSKKDAEFMGLGGERCPDIVFCVKPIDIKRKLSVKKWESLVAEGMWAISRGTHGPFIPSLNFSLGTMQALFIIKGPGIKHGYRSERAISLADIAPTLCYLIGLRPPAQSEGRVLTEFLE